MSSKLLEWLWATQPNLVDVSGSFVGNGASDPGTVNGKGVSSVSRTAAGVYKVSFDKVWPALISFNYALELGTIDDISAYISDVDLTNQFVELTVRDHGDETSAPSNADLTSNDTLYFTFRFRNSKN